ncbi:putative RNA-directed DNA polymerase [Helianthus annuus]|uniref:RNA-directed DNA polymerase n=1 Tax=Helianthus annuus TaxID=4232 RepID=A0A251V6J0_HELAN|nr:uncharacterized protein LOC110929441 isoform X2 [Helianthus annuus]KAF5814189.1 putative RNA-directed DNA polymerase [Helianthus annuus]KAJ0592857.1 putative RNA-directed DNA polymerase [Helianthus annuus]KAJ0607859.1 putative RNA-directed DNA polymerase [Helianthus annuus]KAJ0767923.1 putative RNA-directed DNA polymerase [Helianthus annuus]KAJ0943437.1 putative RNA-directed DNA polymerase [Helianthus annuus]
MTDKTDPKNQTSTLHLVYTVTNIQHKVRVLDGVEVSYPTWVKLFTLHATGYEVTNHIDSSLSPDKASPEYPAWKKIDAVVLQWIYGTLTNDYLVRVLEDESTAHEAWVRVKNLFLNNKASRAAALQQELSNLTLASMPNLEAYCQRVRDLTDQLAAVDCPLNNTQKILHLIKGLPREYDTATSILNQNLPTWENACNQLHSEAQRIAARDALSPTPVVAAAISSPQEKSREQQPSSNRDRRSYNRDSHPRRDSNRTGRNNQRGSGQTSNRSYSFQQPQYAPYWPPPLGYPPYWAPPPCPYPTRPWASPVDNRPNSRPSNGQGSSRQQSAQAHIIETDPLEPTQLAAAVNALSMDSGGDQWHFDSGFQGWHGPESSQQF